MSDPREPVHVGVLLFPGVEPLDAIGPAQTFWSLESVRPFVDPFPPVELHLVAEHRGPVIAGYGLVVEATTSYADCPALDILIVPGGTGGEDDDATARLGRRYYERHEPTLAFVRRQAAGAQVMASVCTGAFILGGAGLLAGCAAATHWSARAELEAKMAARGEPFELVTERVVDAGAVVTAGGVSSGIDLGLHVIRRLFGDTVADGAALVIERETPGARV